jgi:hypothetical protein
MKTPTLEFLLTEWEKDAVINNLDPGRELLRIPILHAKYNKFLTLHNLASKRQALELDRMRKIKWAYYSGKMDKEELDKYGWQPFPFVLKTDINAYLDGDIDIGSIKKKKSYHEEASSFCVYVMKELNNRTWQLKEYMAWERFQSGG